MTIWILTILILLILTARCYVQGAIQSGVSLIGLIVGLALALPLSPYIMPVFPKIGLVHPLWKYLLAPVLIVIIFELIFASIGFALHRPVALYFKYKTDDVTRLRFERINQRVGACIGCIMAVVYMVALGVIIGIVGYPAVVFNSNDSDPAWLKLLRQLRVDMNSTGLDKIAAKFDPMPKKYYEVVDVLAILHNNPTINLIGYPPFFTLAQRDDMKDLVNDKDFQEFLLRKPPLMELVQHPRILEIANNTEVRNYLLNLDVKDFYAYLETGKSPKWDSYKIIGLWELDLNQVIIEAKKRNPDISARELRALRQFLNSVSSGTFTFLATTDKNVKIEIADFTKPPKLVPTTNQTNQGNASQQSTESQNTGVVNTDQYTVADEALARRYGTAYLRRRTATPQPQPQPQQQEQKPQEVKAQFEKQTITGSWEGEGDTYLIKVNLNNKQTEVAATVKAEFLELQLFGYKLLFIRII